MKKAALPTLVLTLLATLAYAVIVLLPLANGKLTGKITDSKTGEAIPGATIMALVDKENKGAVASDLDGNFNLNLPAGTYTIEIKALGFDTKRIDNIIIINDKTTELSPKLEVTSKALSSVTITEERYSRDEDSGVRATPTESYDMAPAGDDYRMSEAPAPTLDAVTITSASGSTKGKSSGGSKAPAYKLSESSGEKSSPKVGKGAVKGESKRFEPAEKEGKETVVREPDTHAGQLTAGEWSDNRNWEFFRNLHKKEWERMEPLWGFYFNNRYTAKVVSGGKPQNDVPVVLKGKKGNVLFEGRTDINGYCYLFAGFTDKGEEAATFEVKTDGGVKSVAVGEAGSTRATNIEITRSKRVSNKVDIMFTIDATGSMGDELLYLKEELSDVIRRVKASSEQMVDIRMSANVYRDRGDEYVVRAFPFTNDISRVLGDLSAQSAGGGGDFPEAVEEGLDDAINKHDWSDDATARLLFLVLDAPPHNTTENKAKIAKAVINAAKKGIRIIPVASSGIDKETEFFLRYIAAATGGTYVFLTDHSGIGGSHIEPTIGKYDVEYLNNLMVRLIQAYLTTES